jgi:hypothetical protein
MGEKTGEEMQLTRKDMNHCDNRDKLPVYYSGGDCFTDSAKQTL